LALRQPLRVPKIHLLILLASAVLQHTHLPASLHGHAPWLNFFDADDVLGSLLKLLSPSYDQAVRADLEIDVGNLLTAWNPIAHTAYWTDNDFATPVAQLLRDLVVAQQAGT
jgi:hypothetical protein